MDITFKYRYVSQTDWTNAAMSADSYFEPLSGDEKEYTWDAVPLHLSLREYIPAPSDHIQEALLVIEEKGKLLLYTKEYYWKESNYLIHRIETDLELLIIQVVEVQVPHDVIHTLRVNLLEENKKKVEYIKIIDSNYQHIDYSYSYESPKMEEDGNDATFIRNSDFSIIDLPKDYLNNILFTPLCERAFRYHLDDYRKKENIPVESSIDVSLTLGPESSFHYLSWNGNNHFVKYLDDNNLVFIFSFIISGMLSFNVRIRQDNKTRIIFNLEEDLCKTEEVL